ncbi:MAG: D-alanyl-D-alanine carboxypeptidase/D-alanyl-D-alanine-endopeptidase [Gemmatimonadetes bacterium]|nr:D-alanyl-D-alanine carboxypeptidase/D-alanyl-D-alanine-endopeptidase [Gemmatimonadota bacterium]
MIRRGVPFVLVAMLLAARPVDMEGPTAQEPSALRTDGVESGQPSAGLSTTIHPGDGPGLEAGPVLHPRPPSPPLATAREALQRSIDGILGGTRWRGSEFGVLVVDGETGDTLYARQPHVALAPASNLKVLTTAAALHLLGPDFRWMTWVTTDAPIVDGVVQGDVILFGTGDPFLRPSRAEVGALDALAAALRDRGIRRVEGRVLGDATYFSGPDRLEAWDPRDLNDWFAAASPALSYNGNMVQLRVEASTAGSPPRVHTDPAHEGVAVDNEARTSSGRPASRLQVLRDAPTEPIRIVGEIQRGGRDVYRSMTVQDPVLFTAHGFDRALRDAGIRVVGEPGTIRESSRSPLAGQRVFTAGDHEVLASHRSPPLLEALAIVNIESHNLFADLVLRTLGRVEAGEGSYAAGAAVVEGFAVDEVGVGPDEVRLVDGSGLAADNRASPGALVAVLRHALASGYGEALLETLPEAGTRQLRRMARTPAARNLRAKTGTIEGVSALSGLVRTADDRPAVFSIMGNDLPSAWGAKRLEDEIGAAVAGWSSSR